ncbi:MAG: ferritin-like domain-containing protein [Alphaproteobacteria bacterium]|nr:ferritin-like domain-containing protein [Alphaproteobacteria bacterium]
MSLADTQLHEPTRKPTLLDAAEERFPLRLGVEIQKVRDLFRTATRNQWDPRTDIDWSALDDLDLDDDHRTAARMYWSRRAWSEYGAISESPALLIRFCQERREPDLRYFFTIRTQEEARHAEACYRMAEKLGGYFEQPALVDFQKSVATHGVRKMALDPETPLEAIIASLVCAAEEVAFDVFRHLVEITPNKAANQVLRSIMRDEVRHCGFGWAYLEHRIPQMTRGEIEVCERAVITMIRDVEMNGYHSAWLAPESDAMRGEVEADRLTWEAGLGATVEELEKPVFVASVKSIRERLAPLGIAIPTFTHPKFDGPV